MPWRKIRAALEHGYEAIGETHSGSLPDRDWKLVEAAIKFDRLAHEDMCAECRKTIPYRQEIRCLDCRSPLHAECAPRHFWPNGRPRGTSHG